MALHFFEMFRRDVRRFQQAYKSFVLQFQPPTESIVAKLLAEAEKSAGIGDVDTAWKYLNDAQRLQILTFSPAQLEARRQVLAAEVSKKLKGWRLDAINALLKNSTPDTLAQRLMNCQQIFDDFSNTRYHKSGLYRDQLRDLVLISAAAIASLLSLIGVSGTDPSQWGTWDWKRMMMVLLFGVLGACFSATTKMVSDSGDDPGTKSQIPDLVTQGWVTLARTIFGATPALAAYAFLQANIVKLDNGSFAGILVVSFASGFSERYVLKLLKAIDGVADDPKPPPQLRPNQSTPNPVPPNSVPPNQVTNPVTPDQATPTPAPPNPITPKQDTVPNDPQLAAADRMVQFNDWEQRFR